MTSTQSQKDEPVVLMKDRSVELKVPISEQRIADLVCSGMEGGIGYWSQIEGYVEPSEVLVRFDAKQVYKHIDYPMNPGGAVKLSVPDGVKGETHFLLTRAKLLKGLEVMRRDFPRHFANWISENDDAETGDVLIQCALFGDIVFG